MKMKFGGAEPCSSTNTESKPGYRIRENLQCLVDIVKLLSFEPKRQKFLNPPHLVQSQQALWSKPKTIAKFNTKHGRKTIWPESMQRKS